LAGGAGLAGAAVVTSALAAFGPGGMIGGLITAGALMTAGGGGIAYALASPSTSAEAVEAIVGQQLSIAVLRNLQDMDPDHTIWQRLAEMEIELRREYERLDEFSDRGGPTIKELTRKLVAVERALEYLHSTKLAPVWR